jgi:hypothetical protein
LKFRYFDKIDFFQFIQSKLMSDKKKTGRIFIFTSKDTLDIFQKIKEFFKELEFDPASLSEIKIDSKVFISNILKHFSLTWLPS